MTPAQMREAQKLIEYRKSQKVLLADLEKVSVYAIEVRIPARGGRVFVFSNDQPGAQRELTADLNNRICEVLAISLALEIDLLGKRLTDLGVDVEAVDAEEADKGEG